MSTNIRRAVPLLVASILALMMTFAIAVPGTALAWLHPGPTTQYPSDGGTWQYGFWDAKVRSYYTVDRCHGSSLYYNGQLVRSVNTVANQTSRAEKWAYQTSGASDSYYYRTC